MSSWDTFFNQGESNTSTQRITLRDSHIEKITEILKDTDVAEFDLIRHDPGNGMGSFLAIEFEYTLNDRDCWVRIDLNSPENW